MITIPMTLSPALIEVLATHNIKPEDYKPAYGGESVGLDLFYTGDKTITILGQDHYDKITSASPIKPLIPTGVRMALPKGYVCFVCDRGSISKTSLIRRAGVVDPGYTGEIFVNLFGHGTINPGDKLPAQLVVIKAETDYNTVSLEDFEKLTADSQRGDGKTGSTDKK
jgi:dUTPase